MFKHIWPKKKDKQEPETSDSDTLAADPEQKKRRLRDKLNDKKQVLIFPSTIIAIRYEIASSSELGHTKYNLPKAKNKSQRSTAAIQPSALATKFSNVLAVTRAVYRAALLDNSDVRRWYWRFAQQNLPGWAPILTANWVVLYFFCVCVFCIALGVPILTASLGVKEYSVRYDNVGPFAQLSRDQQQNLLQQSNGDGVPVTVDLPIRDKMEPPVSQLHHVIQQLTSLCSALCTGLGICMSCLGSAGPNLCCFCRYMCSLSWSRSTKITRGECHASYVFTPSLLLRARQALRLFVLKY